MPVRQFEDTTDFFRIDSGDEIHIGGRRFSVTRNERERRFGIDDPKYWVKRVVDQETGVVKILKLAFFESFITTLGSVRINRFRNPKKEGDILGLVKGLPHFMQGTVFYDSKGNNVRVLDIITGQNLFVYLDALNMAHEAYFHKVVPEILTRLQMAFEAIVFLHKNGFKHGDIRNDHLIVEKETGNLVWIDFDYDYETKENPFSLDIFGVGNILLYAIGKGIHTYSMISRDTCTYGDAKTRIGPEDFSILDKGRLVNLRKIYPYIPPLLNEILMHFSRGANVYYESVAEIIENVNWYLMSL
ncbi:conserved hypothetical protein [delta proteobacterium NaphS2]|nr:conserved hypothetical protein [delta proteobacterium NaphS2]